MTEIIKGAQFKVFLEHEFARLPKKAHESDAGWDLCSCEHVTIPPKQWVAIDTGIKFVIPNGWEIQIRSRSGLAAKKGIFVMNSPGTIDCFSENTKIKTIDGDKKIDDITLNDIVFSMSDDVQITKNKITAIINTGEQKTICIEDADGDVLEVTENTEIYTNNGLKYAKDLTENDFIIKI